MTPGQGNSPNKGLIVKDGSKVAMDRTESTFKSKIQKATT